MVDTITFILSLGIGCISISGGKPKMREMQKKEQGGCRKRKREYETQSSVDQSRSDETVRGRSGQVAGLAGEKSRSELERV